MEKLAITPKLGHIALDVGDGLSAPRLPRFDKKWAIIGAVVLLAGFILSSAIRNNNENNDDDSE